MNENRPSQHLNLYLHRAGFVIIFGRLLSRGAVPHLARPAVKSKRGAVPKEPPPKENRSDLLKIGCKHVKSITKKGE